MRRRSFLGLGLGIAGILATPTRAPAFIYRDSLYRKPLVGSADLLLDGWVWPLWEGGGTEFRSIGRPGSLTNQVPTKITWATNVGGLGLSCDGSISNRADVGNVITGPPFTLYAAFSATATSLPFLGGIVSCCGGGASNQATIQMQTDFRVRLTVTDQVGAGIAVTTSSVYNDGRLHWAVGIGRSTSDWSLWVDGIFQGSSTTTLAGGFAWTKSLIGEDTINNGQAFNGMIYAAGIWPYALQSGFSSPYEFMRPRFTRRYFAVSSPAVTTTTPQRTMTGVGL